MQRFVVTAHIKCIGNDQVSAAITFDEQHPTVIADSSLLRLDEVLGWLRSQAIQPPPDALFRLRVAPSGGNAKQRAAVLALPWSGTLPSALISLSRGKAPKRPELRLPLQLSTTRPRAFLEARLDDFVRQTTAWKISSQGHVVLARATDRIDTATASRTRLAIIETRELAEPPAGTFSVLQIAASPAEMLAFEQKVLRGIFHDQPLDEAVHHALEFVSLAPTAIRLDLYDGDVESLRLRHALHEAAGAITSAMPHFPKKNGGGMKGLESLQPDLADLATAFNAHATHVDFAHEVHGANSSAKMFEDNAGTLDEADAARASADDIELDRSAQAWLATTDGADIAPDTALEVGATYRFQFQIASEIRAAATVAKLSNKRLRELFTNKPKLELDVVLFADPSKLELADTRLEVVLERWGATEVEGTSLVPLVPGVHPLRVCVYYRGNLLQSLMMQLGVGRAGIPSRVDFTGVDTFAGLAALPEVAHSIFINDAGGQRWIGVYSPKEAQLGELAPYKLAIPAPLAVVETVPKARKALSMLEGDVGAEGSYRFSAEDPPPDAQTVAYNDGLLVKLASEGRRMFSRLMQAPNTNEPSIQDLDQRLKIPDRVVSIARLDNETSVPWSLMYDMFFDPKHPQLALCTKYRRAVGTATYAESPSACSSQADCPLKLADTARATVCPFGFWGFRHEIELRLRPADGEAHPIDRTKIEAAAKPRAAAAMFDFPETVAHLAELNTIVDAGGRISDRTVALDALRAGDRSLYYFFCHADQEDSLQLRLAEENTIEPESIPARYEAADDLWNLEQWDKHRPFVFLNACYSIALDAQLISPFLDKFFGMGASAIVGSEIRVYTELAASVAKQLLTRMVTHGETLGTAMLRVRRAMLGVGNPMGLAYSVYGSAALHFHRDPCPRCV